MTPEPTVVDEVDADVHQDRSPTLSDRAADVAFGGQSSEPAATPADSNGSLPLLFGFIALMLAIGYFRSWWFPGIVAGLLFMLFMHELGHYLTARASGMKVTEFFLGFGPKIWSFRRGETEYGVKGIPAGAYVRIMGMTNLDEIDPAEEHRTYRSQPYWQRMMTICAGSAMHFLMATVALVVLFASYSYAGFNGPPWAVGTVVPNSTASNLGIEVGDEIRSVNGETFDNWDEFGDVIAGLEEGPVEIKIRRAGEERTLNGQLGLRPEDIMLDGFGLSLLVEVPGLGSQAAFVWPGDPADDFGIQVGDVLLRAGGVEDPTEATMADMLRAREGDTIDIEVLRGSDIVSLVGTARANTDVAALLAEFGLEPGDRLLRIGDVNGPTDEQLAAAFADAAGETVRVQVLRGGEVLSLDGTVRLASSVPFRGFFGVGPSFAGPVENSLGESLGLAVDDFATISETNIVGMVDLANPANWSEDEAGVERRAAARRQAQRPPAVPAADDSCNSGPDTNRPLSVVGIGRLIACSESADQVLFLFAVVNIFIGIFNLVPLLPLDGGHAAIATYERARGLLTGKPHRVDAAKLIPVTWLVIFGLVGLGAWTVILDIFSW